MILISSHLLEYAIKVLLNLLNHRIQMKFSFPALFFFLSLLGGLSSISPKPVLATDDCSNIVSTPTETKIAIGFGYAVYSDLVKGTIPIESSTLCLDESGEIVQPEIPMICSFSGTSRPGLSYDSDTDSLVATISDLGFSTTHSSASVIFDVTSLEKPSGSNFILKSGDLSAVSSGGRTPLLMGSGLPLLVAQSNDGLIPFSVEFSNASIPGAYRAVVIVSCTF